MNRDVFRRPLSRFTIAIVSTIALTVANASASAQGEDDPSYGPALPREVPDDPPAHPHVVRASTGTSPARGVFFGAFQSIQVNTNGAGQNITGDAANEPSIAVSPVNPSKIAIGWRQFDTISSNFRQAGRAYSQNSGQTWTFPGVLDPGQFRSDPVLASDADGVFYYYSLSSVDSVELFKSVDGGVNWTGPVPGFGGDKEWMTVDRTSGIGRGNIYTIWNIQFTCCPGKDFTRSTNGGLSFESPIKVPVPSMKWGTMDVGPDGTLYLAGSELTPSNGHLFAKSTNAQVPNQTTFFDATSSIDLGGTTGSSNLPNPAGLLGQVWVATDHSGGPTNGNVYVLGSVNPAGADPLDVMFIRSTDGGDTWSSPARVNDDVAHADAWQWFGTMSVAPNGRIDVVWNDTRNHLLPTGNMSELFYTSSFDGGTTWSPNKQVSPAFDSLVGWPQQNKIGDYYHMVSDNGGANLAYAATFNGEQDVYFLRIPSDDCNDNGISDAQEIADGLSLDCNLNEIPDECEFDCNDTGVPDDCDVTAGTSEDCDFDQFPDECELNFDGKDMIDDCDPDIDNDGVLNAFDVCDFTPLDVQVDTDGSPFGDNSGNCVIDLPDLIFYISCLDLAGPGIPHGLLCRSSYDYNGDLDVDLDDFSHMQNAFGK